MRDYRKYDVWIKSHALVLIVYKQFISKFPKEERFGLASQMKRAASSIPLTIAEGCGKNTDRDFVRFLDMSLGSAQELEYCFLLAKDLDFICLEDYMMANEKINEIKAKLIKLIKTIRNNNG
ncbi:MAG: four helix bundle protein [Bacteroidetes bacterium]|nr:four helix bundle protein [Bacteroidota bacterium]